jgi:hypothetical protein
MLQAGSVSVHVCFLALHIARVICCDGVYGAILLPRGKTMCIVRVHVVIPCEAFFWDYMSHVLYAVMAYMVRYCYPGEKLCVL